jgi:hypothetical protein
MYDRFGRTLAFERRRRCQRCRRPPPSTRLPSRPPDRHPLRSRAMTEHAGTTAARHHRGDESGQGSHAWNMPSGTDMYDGDSGSQARTSKACRSQAPTSSPRHLDPTTVAAPEARRTRRAPSTAVATIRPFVRVVVVILIIPSYCSKRSRVLSPKCRGTARTRLGWPPACSAPAARRKPAAPR